MTITLAGNLVPPVVALASGPVLAHALGVDGRGAVAAAVAPLSLAITLVTFGIPEAVTWVVARRPGLVRLASRNASWLILLTGLLATGGVLLARPVLSGGDLAIEHLMAIASLSVVPSMLLGVVRGIASGMQRWGMVAWEKVVSSVLRLLAVVGLALADMLTPLSATILLAAMPLTGALAYLRLPRYLAAPEPDVDGTASTGRITTYGSRLWIGSLSGILLSRIDQTMMTPLAGAYQLGLYVVAVSVAELPLILHRAVRDVSFVADAHRSDDARLAAAARISTALSALVALGLGLTMPAWIPVLFGREFAGSVPVAAVLLVSTVLTAPGSIAGVGLSARGRPGLRSISLAGAALLDIVLLVVLLPRYGAMGAAWATLIALSASSLANLWFLHRLFGVRARSFLGVRRSDVVLLAGYVRTLSGGVRARARRR